MNKNRVVPLESLQTSNSEVIRKRLQGIVDGKGVAIVMAIVTLWVLFGDDIRLVSTTKSPDIPYLRDPFLSLFNVELYNVNVGFDTSTYRDTIAESYTTRAIQTIRYIRLVRIVKLYKYFTKKKIDDPANFNSSNTMDAEVLGKKLSDITTRRVIIGVLSLLLLLPLLQYQTVDNAKYYGLQQLYWVGSSSNVSDILPANQTIEYLCIYKRVNTSKHKFYWCIWTLMAGILWLLDIQKTVKLVKVLRLFILCYDCMCQTC